MPQSDGASPTLAFAWDGSAGGSFKTQAEAKAAFLDALKKVMGWGGVLLANCKLLRGLAVAFCAGQPQWTRLGLRSSGVMHQHTFPGLPSPLPLPDACTLPPRPLPPTHCLLRNNRRT